MVVAIMTAISFKILFKFIFISSSLVLLANISRCTMEKDIETKIYEFFTRFWEWRLRDNPEMASSIGEHRYDDRLTDMSLNSFNKRKDELGSFLSEIKLLSKLAKIVENPSLHLDIELLEKDIEQYLSGLKFKPYLWPLNNMEGPQIGFPRLISSMRRESNKDFVNIIRRMRAFQRQIHDIIELMTEGIRLQWTMNEVSFKKSAKVFKEMAEKNFSDSSFSIPFLVKPTNISRSDWNKLLVSAKYVVEQEILPSYKTLSHFISDVYRKKSRPYIGVSSLPNGKEFYEACLRFHTTTTLTSAEIHQIGLKEVTRINLRMEEVRSRVGYNGSLTEFRKFLRNSKQFGFKSANEIIRRYEGLKRTVDKSLPLLFQRLPKFKYIIKPVPIEVAPTYPIGYYTNVSPDGKEPGIFYANTYMPTTRRRYVSLSLFLHEAVPGHHLQTSLTYEYGSSVSFRKFVGIDERYSQVPAQFAMNSAYLEGWGLYSEYLGEELGLYTDPYDLFGRLSSEMLRACRLVLDTGIHLYGWTRSRAIEYLKLNTAEDELDIVSEIDRYITWPGQACAYKIGEMKIKELRKRAQKALGCKFNVKKFHDFIATIGGVPLNVLEEQLDEFVHTQRQTMKHVIL